ncbi:MAG: hemerythrin domain-containing protein [Burkholderiaceae bacterium]|jgi:hemerythrin superfamily protein
MTQTIEARSRGHFPADDPMQGLEHDHNYVRQLMQRYLSTSDQQIKQQAGPRICEALEMHTSVEEATFYPRVEQFDPDMIERCLSDHEEADQLIMRLQNLSAGEPEYDALMQELHDVVIAHMALEEEQLFPAVREAAIDLHELANNMQAYESNLVAAQASQSAQRPGQSR